jgi:uncharacterized protein YicC (UPF0701 family)
MDIKKEDRTEESKKNHIAYYKSLTKIISNIQKEKEGENEQVIKEHLESRINAMEEDKKRIKEMFPEIKEEEWNGHTN